MTDAHIAVSQECASAAEQPVHCVDCGSTNVLSRGACSLTSSIRGLPDYERNLNTERDGGELFVCQNCSLGFRYPQVTEAELQALYADMPATRWNYEARDNSAWTIAAAWLRQHFSSTGSRNLLDVGACAGLFLSSLPAGWKSFAIEPSAAAGETLAAMGVPVIGRFLEPASPEYSRQMDVVTLFDVFEHLRQPGRCLTHACSYLKPGGYLIVSTGNTEHWSWKLLAGNHWYCHPLQHLTFASRTFFSKWASANGCSIATMRKHPHHPAPTKTVAVRAMETMIWAGLKSRWTRALCSRLMKIPSFRHLRHRETGPYAPELADHLLVVMRKN